MYDRIGSNAGFDSIGYGGDPRALVSFLSQLEREGNLPKMILYSLNQYDNETLATIAGSFQTDSEIPSRIQLGAAWWFNDHQSGMRKHLTDLGNLGVLGNFVGMLTDSRSFLSYTRHEYFRRILCNHLGNLVERGEYPQEMESLGQLAQDICFHNAKRYFGFDIYGVR